MADHLSSLCPEDIKRGLCYDDLSPTARAQVAQALSIPADFASTIPAATMTIGSLCNASLPSKFGELPSGLTPARLLVDSPAHPITLELLLAIPLLPERLLSATSTLLPQAFLDGMSVYHPAYPHALPLWVVEYWLQLYPACAAREGWLASEVWTLCVEQRSLGNDESLLSCTEKLRALLSITPWDLALPQLHKDAHISILQALLADGRLNQDYINMMVGLLCARLALIPTSRTVILNLCEVSHVGKLALPEQAAAYPTAHRFRSLRNIGERLVSRDIVTIAFPYHLPGIQHWAAFRIDRSGDASVSFAYGDSLGAPPPPAILDSFRAWMTSAGLVVEPGLNIIPHGIQEDAISCGVAAINTLEHSLFGTPKFRFLRRDTFRIAKALEVLSAYHRNDFTSCVPLEFWPLPSLSPSSQRPASVLSVPDLPLSSSQPVVRPGPASTPKTALVPKATTQTFIKFEVLTEEQKAEREQQRLATLAQRQQQAQADKEIADQERADAAELATHEKRLSGKARAMAFRERKKAAEMAAGKRDEKGKLPRKPRKKSTVTQRAVPPAMIDPNPAAAVLPTSPFVPAPSSSASHPDDTTTPDALPAMPAASSSSTVFVPEILDVQMTEDAPQAVAPPAPVPQPSVPSPASSTPLPVTSLAELSRPFRMFKKLPKPKKCAGRPKTNAATVAVRVNWQNPLLWPTIQAAALRAGPGMSPAGIVHEAQKMDPQKFNGLKPQTLGDWIERPPGGVPRWNAKTLARVDKQYSAGGEVTRIGILAANPELAEKLKKKFKQLRDAGVPISIHTAHALTQGMITHYDANLFELNIGKGAKFVCSLTWVRRAVMHNLLGFSLRQPTRAAQKLPNDVLQLGDKYYMRVAYTADRYLVPPELIVNSDQTQTRYAYGSDSTWAEKGSKQVPVVGHDEKRAFTLNVGISMSGDLLPFQAIFTGMTNASIPSANARGRQQADDMGFLLEPSKTKTYWSTQKTMQSYAEKILMPHFERKRVALGLPEDQRFIWLIDAWSVHRSAEFRQWMKTHYPRIIILYVPANCTSVYQPCDVGIQRVLKHALKRAAHIDVVAETVAQLDSHNGDADRVKLDISLPTLRDRTVQWMIKAYEACKNPEFVKKAWYGVQVGENRLTEEFLTSRSTLLRLRTLHESDPALWKELTGGELTVPVGTEPDPTAPDADPALDDDSDDTTIPTADVIAAVMGDARCEEWTTDEHGALRPSSVAESDDPDLVLASVVPQSDEVEEDGGDLMDVAPAPSVALTEPPSQGRPKRARLPPGWYADLEDLPL